MRACATINEKTYRFSTQLQKLGGTLNPISSDRDSITQYQWEFRGKEAIGERVCGEDSTRETVFLTGNQLQLHWHSTEDGQVLKGWESAI